MKTTLTLRSLLISLSLSLILINFSNSQAAPETVIYFDMVIDDDRQLIFASDSSGGKIDVISITTLQVVNSIPVGSVLYGIDISLDNSELAVASNSPGEIVFIDIDTLTVTNRVVPWTDYPPSMPYDVMYGRPGLIYSTGWSERDYVHVFDTSTKIEMDQSQSIILFEPRLSLSQDGNILYAYEGPIGKLESFIVSTSEIKYGESDYFTISSKGSLCVMPNGNVYTSTGLVFSADLSSSLEIFPISVDIECAGSLNTIFISTNSNSIIAIDTITLAKKYETYLGAAVGVARLNDDETKLFISTANGIKVLPTNIKPQIYIPSLFSQMCFNFIDSFSLPGYGFPVYEDSYMLREYLNGEYRMLSKNGDYIYLSIASTCPRLTYSVEVSARWAGPSGYGYGLLFGLKMDPFTFFYFELEPDIQQYQILFYYEDHWSMFKPPTNSQIINPGMGSNHLKILVEKDYLSFFINEILVTYAENDEIANFSDFSYIGLATNPYATQPISDARFDDFKRLADIPNSPDLLTFPVENTKPSSNGDMLPLPISDELNWKLINIK